MNEMYATIIETDITLSISSYFNQEIILTE